MTVKTSPLRLEDIILKKEKIESYPEREKELCSDKKFEPSVDFSVQFGEAEVVKKDKVRKYDAIVFSLKVNYKKKKAPFKADIEGVALFFADTKDEIQRTKLIIYNGTVIIYGFLRGYLYSKVNLINSECRLIPAVDLRSVIEQAIKEFFNEK